MKFPLYCLLLSFFIVSCSKKDDSPAQPTADKTYVTSIVSLKTENLATDTTNESLPPIEGDIATPKSEVAFKEPFKDLPEDLSISLNRIDSLPFDLRFQKPLLIPYLTLGRGVHSLVFSHDDSIRVDAYKTRQTFNFNRDHSTYSFTFTAPVSYRFKRYYKRIHFTADIRLNVKDNEGNFITLTGTLKGSTVETTSTEMNVY